MIAAVAPPLFRQMYGLALQRHGQARTLYHVTPDLASLPAAEDLADGSCCGLLDDADARRVLHIAYGELLGVQAVRTAFFGVLGANLPAYWTSLGLHLDRHLVALGVPCAQTGGSA